MKASTCPKCGFDVDDAPAHPLEIEGDQEYSGMYYCPNDECSLASWWVFWKPYKKEEGEQHGNQSKGNV